MKRNNLYVSLMAFAILLVGASCSDDDNTPSYSTGVVQNTELKTILVQRGYTFNEDGNLLLDDLAKNTTTLDLSGTQISTDALAELSMFPNLTDVDLSDNGYGPAFDFAKLPEQITGVDLTGNEIYDYNNLISVIVEENGDETITNLRDMDKLYLPEEAKYNCTDLMRFYRQNREAITDSSIDMKMEDENGNLQTYTTLRDIPDEALRNTLQASFSSMFTEDGQIDLGERLNSSEKINMLVLEPTLGIKNYDGVQYIANHPYWEGTGLGIMPSEKTDWPRHLKIGKTVNMIVIQNVNAADGINFSEAENLYYITMQEVDGLETLDLSASKIFGQRGDDIEEDPLQGSTLMVLDCPALKEIILPDNDNLTISTVDIEYLPQLEKLDLGGIQLTPTLMLGDFGTNTVLTYPNLTRWGGAVDNTSFICSEKTFQMTATQDFIKKYNVGGEGSNVLASWGGLNCSKNKAHSWN
ncbi:hypothetical protein [uncultured Bacteroides sp.]|uniref:hypothetical protein n=1 Tax=uncultured Bacteroides sp. TaxID=162156 RepID=UPI002675C96A|nr:hypothetical protein [uncultured Bacteroides sp.]